jgi:hypothetical protein
MSNVPTVQEALLRALANLGSFVPWSVPTSPQSCAARARCRTNSPDTRLRPVRLSGAVWSLQERRRITEGAIRPAAGAIGQAASWRCTRLELDLELEIDRFHPT